MFSLDEQKYMPNKGEVFMTKKKSFITLLLAFCLIVSAMFMLTACGSDKQIKLSNDSGFEIVGGGFEEGSVLNAKKVEISSVDANEIFEKITGFGVAITDKTKAFIYDIFVSKDDKKVQPNGKVKVNIPMSTCASGYKVYHIKDGNTVEELTATFADGVISFETSSFSYYVFVATEAINPIPETPAAGTEAEWNAAMNHWQAQNNVKVVEHFSSEGNDDPSSPSSPNQTMIYQFNGTAYSEDGYFDDEAESYKGKALYLVKESETYYRVEWSDGKSENDGSWEKIDYMADTMYAEYLNRNIYNCIDFYAEHIDFTYTNFTYDATNKIYKNADETVTVAFIFENGNLTKIVVTVFFNDAGTVRTSARTITFGNAVVNVPEVSE